MAAAFDMRSMLASGGLIRLHAGNPLVPPLSLLGELKRRKVYRVATAYPVIAWVIVQVAETVFPLFGFDDSLARGTVIALAIGFVPALVVTWLYELTPQGLRRERAAEPDLPADLASKHDGAAKTMDRSIAVLPFSDLSPARDQEYFSDGVAEELLNVLVAIPELRVISRASVFAFKGKQIELPEIGRRLGVSYVLDGSVRLAGGRVRISVKLIDARTDTHIWSERYDHDIDDILAIQDEIAARVVDKLKATLVQPVAVTQVPSEAYTLYLRARHASDAGGELNMRRAQSLYEAALNIAPQYTAAWTGLSINFFRLATGRTTPMAEAYRQSREAIERALQIDPGYAPAHAHSAWLAMFVERDLAAAARSLNRALRLAPTDAWIIGRAAALLYNLGRVDDAITLGEYEISHDPLSVPACWNQGMRQLAARRWREAADSFATVLELAPEKPGARAALGEALLRMGDLAAARAEIERETDAASRLLGLARLEFAVGDRLASDRALAQAIEQHGEDDPAGIASVLAYRGERDRAFEWLAKVASHSAYGWLGEELQSAAFDNLREDLRWQPVLEAHGLAPKQLSAVAFAVSLPDRQRPDAAAMR